MLNYLSLEEFIKTGEDVTKEFKPNFKNHRTDISKSMVAFANDLNWVGGGYVYLGVENDGTSRGISENYDEIQQILANICRNQITPPLAPLIKKLPYQNKHIIEIKITRSINRPHRLNEICHVRIGSTTRRATREEEDLIKQCSIIPSFDNQPLAQATKDDIAWPQFKEYLMSTKTPDLFETDPDIINIAANLEFIIKVDKKILPKVGTILLFGTNPNKFFPSCKVQAVKFKGLDLTAPISTRQLFEGTLPNLIRSSRKFLEGISSTASVFLSDSKDRVDYVEYPFWAVREALSNAIFHRDYSETGREIDIRVFDDRIEIMSPGGLGGGLTVDDLGTGKRYIRNLFIADVLSDLKFVERAGTGIMRMRKEMDANGSPMPKFKADQNTFVAILPAHPFYSSQRLLEEANQEKANANYTVAKDLYLKSIEINPTNYSSLHNLADLEMQMGSRENCRMYLKKAIDLQPEIPTAWLSFAIMEEKFRNYDSARDLYNKAAKQVNRPTVILRSWAIMEWNRKKYRDADLLFEKAIKHDPKDFMNWYKKGQMNINSPNEKIMKEGDKALRKASNLTDDSYILSDIYFLLARAMKILRYDNIEIKENYKKSLDLNPGRGSVQYQYGKFLESIGQKTEAQEYIKKSKQSGFLPKTHRKQKSKKR